MRPSLSAVKQTLLQSSLFACVVFTASLLVFLPSPAGAESANQPLWGSAAENFTVKVEDEHYELPKNAGEYCTYQDFTLSVFHRSGNFGGEYKDTIYNACARSYEFGTVTSNRKILQLKGNDKPYYLDFHHSAPVHVPNATSLFMAGTGLHAYDDPAEQIELNPSHGSAYHARFEYVYERKEDARPRLLKDSNGDYVQLDEVDASPNGEWLIVDKGRGKRLLRVNPDTFELLTFPGGVGQYGPHSDHNVDMAISNDGRYAALSGGFGVTFKLYDLSTCVPDPDYNLTAATGCDPKYSRVTEQYLAEQLDGQLAYVGNLQFNDDSTQLSATVIIEYPSGEREWKLITLTAGGQSEPGLDYLALGDSFSSGEGDMDDQYYLPGTNGTPEYPNEKCHLSTRSYPYVIARQLDFITSGINRTFASVACSGAIKEDIIDDSAGYTGQFGQFDDLPGSQLANVKEIALEDFTSGHASQIEFVEKYKPKAITLTIGGNDIGFGDKLKACLMPGTCQNVVKANRVADGREIQAQYNELKELYEKLHEVSPNTKTYVLGYPQFISELDACQENVRLNFDEREYVRQSVAYFNDIIAAAANDAGATYVDIEDSLQGIALCDVTIGLASGLGVNGIVVGDDQFHLPVLDRNIVGNETYHPNPLGHQAMAKVFRQKVPSPIMYDTCPGTTDPADAVCPTDHRIDIPIPDYFQGGNIFTKAQRYLEFAVEVIRDAGQDISDRLIGSFNVSLTNLQPGSPVRFELWSEPVDLDTYMTNADGELHMELAVPDSITPGYHTLRAYVTTADGKEIGFYETVLITGPENDIDGDGTLNEQDQCSFVETANVDQDRDGVDDACDAVIDAPPLPEKPTVNVEEPINADNQNSATVSGEGTPGTAARITIDDSNPATDPVAGEATLEASSTKATTTYGKSFDVSSLDDGALAVTVTLSNQTGSSPAATSNVIKDTRPSEMKVATVPTPNNAGWYNDNVTVTLSASDKGSGLERLTYRTDGAQTIAKQATTAANVSIPISAEGKTTLTYAATDQSGNTTAERTMNIRIDKTAPEMSIVQPKPPVLLGFFGDTLTGSATDNMSGIVATEVTSVSYNRKVNRTLSATCIAGCRSRDMTWQLAPTDLPTGLYRVTARSIDKAGNESQASAPARAVIVNLPWSWR